MHLTIQTFGFDHGKLLSGYKYIADVRNVSASGINVRMTGKDKSVSDTILAKAAAKTWLRKMENSWTPNLEDGDKVGIGCSHGVHRSVAIAYAYADWLKSKGWTVTVSNRDINKG